MRRGRLLSETTLCAVALALAAPPAAAAAQSPSPSRSSPGIAVFAFELEDASAGAAYFPESEADARQLDQATEAVRRLVGQSGRYRPVDVDGRLAALGALAAPARAHALRRCGGCDAAIAARLGADRSLLGVVRRVSRVEYVVRLEMRDARTGALLAEEDSGLQMGSTSSWSRGAARLVEDRLLGSR